MNRSKGKNRAPSAADALRAIDAMDACIFDAEALLDTFADALAEQSNKDENIELRALSLRGTLLVIRDRVREIKKYRNILDAARQTR